MGLSFGFPGAVSQIEITSIEVKVQNKQN